MSRWFEIGLVALVALVLGLAVWAANRSPEPPIPDARVSTMLSGPGGSKALHQVLVQLGQPSERRRTALFTLNSESRRSTAVLVLLDPPISLQPAEIEQVVQFVKTGGAVVAAGEGGGFTSCMGWEPERAAGGFKSDSTRVQAPQFGLRLPRVVAVLKRISTERVEGLKKRGVAAREDACAALTPQGVDTVLETKDRRPVALKFRYRSGGTVTLMADVGWFRNQVWRDSDVPHVILPLLTPPRRGRVVWDEYHQGFGKAGPTMLVITWEWLLRSPAGWALLQLVAVGLVWLAVTAVRFGPPLTVIERRRRSPLEHLEALAAGLESAGDAGTAVQRIVAGLRRRLSRAGHVGTADVKAWLETLELATTSARGRASVRRLRHLISQRGGAAPERALDAAQAVEDLWEELRPRTTRDAF